MRKAKRVGKDLEPIEVELDDATRELATKLAELSGHTPQTVLEVLLVIALIREGLIK